MLLSSSHIHTNTSRHVLINLSQETKVKACKSQYLKVTSCIRMIKKTNKITMKQLYSKWWTLAEFSKLLIKHDVFKLEMNWRYKPCSCLCLFLKAYRIFLQLCVEGKCKQVSKNWLLVSICRLYLVSVSKMFNKF